MSDNVTASVSVEVVTAGVAVETVTATVAWEENALEDYDYEVFLDYDGEILLNE